MKIKLLDNIRREIVINSKGSMVCKIPKCNNKKKNGRCGLLRVQMKKDRTECLDYVIKV